MNLNPHIRVLGGLRFPSSEELSARQVDVTGTLIAAGAGGATIDELATVIWGQTRPSSASVMIRQALAGIRQVLPGSTATIGRQGRRYFWLSASEADYTILADLAHSIRRGVVATEVELFSVLELRSGPALPDCFGPQVSSFRSALDLAYLDLLKGAVGIVSDTGLSVLGHHLRSALVEFPDDLALRRGLLDVVARLDGSVPHTVEGRTMRLAVGGAGVRLIGVPGYLTQFVGRHAELELLESLVGGNRLVTIIGPAGIGKSRLAIEFVKRSAAKVGADSVVFVDCADDETDADLRQRILRAVGADQQSLIDGPPEAEPALRTASRGGRLLLVLDNCESLGEGVAKFIGPLASNWSDAFFVVSSQLRVGLAGEVLIRLDALTETEAIDFAVSRLDTVLKPTSVEAVSRRIATDFGGVPLTIEIATGIVRDHGPDFESFDVVSVTAPRLASRSAHDRLSTAMRWSWERLTQPEKETLMAVAQFSRPVSPAAVEVVSASSTVGADLWRLANLSLITDIDGHVEMVDSVRRFGRFQTRRSPSGPGVADRFREHLLAMVEDPPFEQLLLAGSVVSKLDEALPDLRPVFSSLLATNPSRARRLFERLVGVWWQGARYLEAAHWADQLWPEGFEPAEGSLSNVAIALRQQEWDLALDVLDRQRASDSRPVRIISCALLAAASYSDQTAAWGLLDEAAVELRQGPALSSLEGVVTLMRGELLLLRDRTVDARSEFRVALRRLDADYSWWVGVAALGLLAAAIDDPGPHLDEALDSFVAASPGEQEPARLVLARALHAIAFGRLGVAKRLVVAHLAGITKEGSVGVELLETLVVCTVYLERGNRPALAARSRRTIESTYDRWTIPWIRAALGPPIANGPETVDDAAAERQRVAVEVLSVLERRRV